jgi:hypothetical protein
MPRTSVFVACPYTLFPLADYKNVFTNVRKAFPVEFLFADEQITNMHIMEKITNYILDSEFSLFDVTGWNPNVTLELGIAVGLRRQYYILFNPHLHKADDAPADIRGIDRLQYTTNTELEAKLGLLLQTKLPQTQRDTDQSFEDLKSRIKVCLVQDQTGLSSGQVADQIGERPELVRPILYSMLNNGDIKSMGAKRGTKYYPPSVDLRRVRH